MNLFIAVLFNFGPLFALEILFIPNLDEQLCEFFLFFQQFWQSLVLIFDNAFIFFIDAIEICTLSTVVQDSFIDKLFGGTEVSLRLESFEFLFWGEEDCVSVGFWLGF